MFRDAFQQTGWKIIGHCSKGQLWEPSTGYQPNIAKGIPDEFNHRYNNKDISNLERFQKAIKNSHKARLTYKELTSEGKLFKAD